jgi:3'-phosphoadenosine 5'-phosphosulfate sulfotransferase (PAPS reductase)/FAD synthetase
MFSGGAASFCAAQRACESDAFGSVELLFCDVGEEDQSTLLAVERGAETLSCRLHWISKNSVWGLFREQGMMGKPGAGLCSRILKREAARDWMDKHRPAATVAIGLTWEEMHRQDGVRRFWGDRRVYFPMVEKPWLTKCDMTKRMDAAGVPVPELYRLGGFEHANCAGACVKAGHGQWARLLEVRPEVYERWERNEQDFREAIGKDVSILRDRRGGPVKPMTLRAFRERVQSGEQIDLFAGGGSCGCFTDMDED